MKEYFETGINTFSINNVRFLRKDNNYVEKNSKYYDEQENEISDDEVFEVITGDNLMQEYKYDKHIYFCCDVLGLNFVNFSDPWENRVINFCVYETNSSGKGYRIINNFDLKLSSDMLENELTWLTIKTQLLNIDDDLKPLQGSWENVPFDKDYNFLSTALHLRIFGSKQPIDSLEELDRHFYSISSIVFDTKIPFISQEKVEK